MSISIEVARRVMEGCKQRALELRSPVSIAIVDAGGHLVLFERMMAPYGWATGNICIAKASTAVMFNQSTDAVAQWGSGIPGFAASMASMSQGRFIMAAGGWPIRVNGTTVGGIGVSGGNAPGRDDDIARAGLAALEPAHAPHVPHSSYMPQSAAQQPARPMLQPMQPAQAQQQQQTPLQPAPSYPTISQAQIIPQVQESNVPSPSRPVNSMYLGNNPEESKEPYEAKSDEQLPADDGQEASHGGQQ